MARGLLFDLERQAAGEDVIGRCVDGRGSGLGSEGRWRELVKQVVESAEIAAIEPDGHAELVERWRKFLGKLPDARDATPSLWARPAWARYWAVNASGVAYWYERKPELGKATWQAQGRTLYQPDNTQVINWTDADAWTGTLKQVGQDS